MQKNILVFRGCFLYINDIHGNKSRKRNSKGEMGNKAQGDWRNGQSACELGRCTNGMHAPAGRWNNKFRQQVLRHVLDKSRYNAISPTTSTFKSPRMTLAIDKGNPATCRWLGLTNNACCAMTWRLGLTSDASCY